MKKFFKPFFTVVLFSSLCIIWAESKANPEGIFLDYFLPHQPEVAFHRDHPLDSCYVDTGELIALEADCFDGDAVTLSAYIQDSVGLPQSLKRMFLLSKGVDQPIEAISKEPVFQVADTGLFVMRQLVFDPLTFDLDSIELEETTIKELVGIVEGSEGCTILDSAETSFMIESCIEVSCPAFAGSLEAEEILCYDGRGRMKLAALPSDPAFVPDGFKLRYLLTYGENKVFQAVRSKPVFRVADTGIYTIHAFVYDPSNIKFGDIEWGRLTQNEWLEMLKAEGFCYDWDTLGASFEVKSCEAECFAESGTMIALDFECVEDGKPVILRAITDELPVIPRKYKRRYLLTRGDSLVIEEWKRRSRFKIEENDLYRIHSFVYNPRTLDLDNIQPGVTTGVDVLDQLEANEICASLDVDGAVFDLGECETDCEANPGTLIPQEITQCLEEDVRVQLIASRDEAPSVPVKFRWLYLLTKGSELVIEAFGKSPVFTVDEAGEYAIHTLVYNPRTLDPTDLQLGKTSASDVLDFVAAKGICAALDVEGASFSVLSCDSVPAPDSCEAFAGTLIADSVSCLDSTMAVKLSATASASPVIPEGYSQLYVLTQDSSLVIRAVSDTSVFTVDNAGIYTIHSLVYDTLTLDLSVVKLDTTTGFDVVGLIESEGICADLDVAGAAFVVEVCDSLPEPAPAPDSCEAFAGTLIADSVSCLDSTMAVKLSATASASPVIPEGYSQLYVLTQDSSLVIRAVSDTSVFTVDNAGIYTIHSLVYDTLTLDLSVVKLDTTTGFDVVGLIESEGICADLDVAGAAFVVEVCDSLPEPAPAPDSCEAFAGTLIADSVSCLDSTMAVKLSATASASPVIPEGYSQLYVLTQDSSLVIRAVSDTSVFTVDNAGIYTIHSLVYDTLTLDLSVVKLDTTTGFDVVGLIESEGICADLDVAGAAFDIGICEDFCDLEITSMKPINPEICLDEGKATLLAVPEDFSDIPDNYTMMFLLAEGEDQTIVQVNEWPFFTVREEGNYSIHAFLYQRKEVYLGMIEFGVSTIDSWKTFMDDIGACSAINEMGAQFKVTDCDCLADAGSLVAKTIDCYDGQSSVLLKFGVKNKPVIPQGYAFTFVLTQGTDKVIEEVYPWPYFFAQDTGQYAIHTLVYHPDSLNINEITLGETTASQVMSLIAEEGICADLDTIGAVFDIQSCVDITKNESDDQESDEEEKESDDEEKEGDEEDDEKLTENDSTSQEFKFSDANADFPQEEANRQYGLYPNPVTKDIFRITAEDPEQGVHMMKLIDMNGRVIKTTILQDVSGGAEIDVRSLPNGMYLMQLLRPSGELTSLRVSIQR